MEITEDTLLAVKQAKRRMKDRERYHYKHSSDPYTDHGNRCMYGKDKKHNICVGCRSKNVDKYNGVWLCPSCIKFYEDNVHEMDTRDETQG